MLAFGAVPAICLAVAMAFVPHTPRWLVRRGREDEARAVLAHSRAKDAIDDEIAGIKEAAQSQHAFRFRQLLGPPAGWAPANSPSSSPSWSWSCPVPSSWAPRCSTRV